jgi:hypothetical protein
MTYCTKTLIPIFDDSNYLEPHGQCEHCERWFHIRALKTFTTHTEPYRFTGLQCLACWDIPIPASDPINKIKPM